MTNQINSCSLYNEFMLSICDMCIDDNAYIDFSPYRLKWLINTLSPYNIGVGFLSLVMNIDNDTGILYEVIDPLILKNNEYVKSNSSNIIYYVRLIMGAFDFNKNIEEQIKFYDKQLKIHATLLRFYDKSNRCLDNKCFNNVTSNKYAKYFNPMGHTASTHESVELIKLFVSEYHPEYTFIDPDKCFPSHGWQKIHHDQLCAAWSLLFAVLSVTCPDINYVNDIAKLNEKELDTLIKKWICWMWEDAKSKEITNDEGWNF